MTKTILREGDKKQWEYKWESSGELITDASIIEYCTALVIPPAYRNVEIFFNGLGKKPPKILYLGKDDKDRPQFIYSKWWSQQAIANKFCDVIRFAKAYPLIMSDIKSNLVDALANKTNKWTSDQIVSLILDIISRCYFRVGNQKYQKLYKSTGMVTLTTRAIKLNANHIKFKFIGKKGVLNECTTVNRLTIRCMEKLLKDNKTSDSKSYVFRYYNTDKKEKIAVTHLDVNNYLKKYDESFTSKLFRTLDTNIILINRFKQSDATDSKERKKTVIAALKEVSSIVNNTPAVAKRAYSDETMIDEYLSHPRKFAKQFSENGDTRKQFITYLEKTKKNCDKV